MQLSARGRCLSLDTGTPRIVGVLNLTPDSFFTQSRITDPVVCADAAGKMLRDGADIIEIGGESTGPGSPDVSSDEECRRVVPAVTAVRSAYPESWIAVDTWKSGVAKACLDAGADIINDVTGGRGDGAMNVTVAEAQAGYVLMYAKDPTPRTTVHPVAYDDVLVTVRSFLQGRVDAAVSAGVSPDHIVVDPGLGHFVSSDASYSYELLVRLGELRTVAPVLVSPSRKSFLAGPSALPAGERLWPTVSASCLAALSGASFIRTHDPRIVKEALTRVSGLRLTRKYSRR